jgi:hypothetical protein
LGFTISKVSWHTQRKGNEGRREELIEPFWVITNFLQLNQLVKRKLADSINEINDDFALESDDLTELGLEFMKKAYDKWLTKVDNGMPPTDITILQKALEKLKGR